MAIAIAGWYGQERLGGGGLGDGLPMVSRVSLLRVVFKIGQIMTACSNSSGGRVVGLLCLWNHSSGFKSRLRL